MSLRAIAVLAGALLVSGCQTNPQGQPVTSADRMPTGAEVPGFRCPPAGTQAIYPRLTVTYHGADPADPVMCVGERSDSTMRRPVLFTLFAELENQDEIRALLSRLYPLEPGRQVSGTFIFRTPGGASLFRHNTSRILGIEDMELDGQTRRVAVVERIEQNPHFPQFHNIRYTIRLDLETGIELSREGEMLRGGPGLMSPAFRAVRLVVPQEAPVAAAARPADTALSRSSGRRADYVSAPTFGHGRTGTAARVQRVRESRKLCRGELSARPSLSPRTRSEHDRHTALIHAHRHSNLPR